MSYKTMLKAKIKQFETYHEIPLASTSLLTSCFQNLCTCKIAPSLVLLLFQGPRFQLPHLQRLTHRRQVLLRRWTQNCFRACHLGFCKFGTIRWWPLAGRERTFRHQGRHSPDPRWDHSHRSLSVSSPFLLKFKHNSCHSWQLVYKLCDKPTFKLQTDSNVTRLEHYHRYIKLRLIK